MRFSVWFGVCGVLSLLPVIGLSAEATDMSSWYVFAPRNTPEPGEIVIVPPPGWPGATGVVGTA